MTGQGTVPGYQLKEPRIEYGVLFASMIIIDI